MWRSTLKRILESNLREQAGSDSFNRFDYQVHWIVYHMIHEYKADKEFLIFCEFHDDMAKTLHSEAKTEFFQIKTSEKFKEWTVSRLYNRNKKKNGEYKHSFLGFIFYNFLKFEDECSKCHFVSNIDIDETIATWQAIIEDDKILKQENLEIYNTLKDAMLSEYTDMDSVSFDTVFEKFIQNTYLYQGGLSLENYEKVVAGEFFQMLDNKDIYTSNSNKILRDLIEEVRKKSKFKVKMPISYKRLIDEKGVSSAVFNKLKEIINRDMPIKTVFELMDELLSQNHVQIYQRKLLIRKLKEHHVKLLDISDVLYQDTLIILHEIIDNVLESEYEKIDDLNFLLHKVHELFEKKSFKHNHFNKVLVEAIFYERILE